MSAVELMKQAFGLQCEEFGESWPDDAEAWFDDPDVAKFADTFAALVTANANAARIAAQTENEVLKAKLAASGVAERRAVREAVLAEREACAKVCESHENWWDHADTIRQRGAA